MSPYHCSPRPLYSEHILYKHTKPASVPIPEHRHRQRAATVSPSRFSSPQDSNAKLYLYHLIPPKTPSLPRLSHQWPPEPQDMGFHYIHQSSVRPWSNPSSSTAGTSSPEKTQTLQRARCIFLHPGPSSTSAPFFFSVATVSLYSQLSKPLRLDTPTSVSSPMRCPTRQSQLSFPVPLF